MLVTFPGVSRAFGNNKKSGNKKISDLIFILKERDGN